MGWVINPCYFLVHCIPRFPFYLGAEGGKKKEKCWSATYCIKTDCKYLLALLHNLYWMPENKSIYLKLLEELCEFTQKQNHQNKQKATWNTVLHRACPYINLLPLGPSRTHSHPLGLPAAACCSWSLHSTSQTLIKVCFNSCYRHRDGFVGIGSIPPCFTCDLSTA